MATQDFVQSPVTSRSTVLPRRSRAQPAALLPKSNFPENKPSSLRERSDPTRASKKTTLSLQLKSPRTTKPPTGPLKSHQRQYKKRKESGVCTSGGCPNRSVVGHTH